MNEIGEERSISMFEIMDRVDTDKMFVIFEEISTIKEK